MLIQCYYHCQHHADTAAHGVSQLSYQLAYRSIFFWDSLFNWPSSLSCAAPLKTQMFDHSKVDDAFEANFSAEVDSEAGNRVFNVGSL